MLSSLMASMRLWLAEKPDAGRQIAKALGARHICGHPIPTPHGLVAWAIGHLLELAPPHHYNPDYRRWNLHDLPIIPRQMERLPIAAREQQLGTILSLIRQASEIVIATDPGREGEHIGWSILEHAGWNGPTLRLWTTALNPSALKTAIQNLKDGQDRRPLHIAARLRSSIDWVDGISWTRYYSLRARTRDSPVISVGRVQTATLALLVQRDLAHEAFKSSDYYVLQAAFQTPEGPFHLFHQPDMKQRITSPAEASRRAHSAARATGLFNVSQQEVTRQPPIPFSLPDIQQAASSRFGWTPGKTLEILQSLYEAEAITYPRTDSGYLPSSLKADIASHCASIARFPHLAHMMPNPPVLHDHMFDDTKTDDHHGIILTTELPDLAGLNREQSKLLELIARRFLAGLMPAATGKHTKISTVLAGMTFSASSIHWHSPEWKRVWQEDSPDRRKCPGAQADRDQHHDPKTATDSHDGENQRLPAVTDGSPARPDSVEPVKRTTRPPPRYTEAGLIRAMMTAGSDSGQPGIAEIMKGCGIGTKATRHQIIEKLHERAYCQRQGRHIVSTPRGRALIQLLEKDGNPLIDIAATANLERALRNVERDPSSATTIWQSHIQQLWTNLHRLKAQTAPASLPATYPNEHRWKKGQKGKRNHRKENNVHNKNLDGSNNHGTEYINKPPAALRGAERTETRPGKKMAPGRLTAPQGNRTQRLRHPSSGPGKGRPRPQIQDMVP